MLSRIAREMAAEIKAHDWYDAHSRLDRAGHRWENDSPSKRERRLTELEADTVRANVAFVTAQVLRHSDPNLDLHEYADACGVLRRWVYNTDGRESGIIDSGLRWEADGTASAPGA